MSEVEKMNEAMYERLGEIAKFASNKRVELDPDFKGDKSDETQNRLMLAAFKELRQMCEFYKPTGADKRKPTMDFGRFHVTRAAIPGTTILTFRRKREHLENFASVVPGRIIVAKITKKDVGGEKMTHRFTVKSYEADEKPRVLFAGDSWASMSKTEKMVYRMVKCNIKETQRRRISRKRAAAAKQQAHDNKGATATHS